MRRLLFLSVILLTGCFAHGFNRSELYSRLQTEKVEVTDADIARAQDLKPQIAFPCKLAIYLSPRNYHHWTARDKERVEAWAEVLKKDGIASDVFLMSELFATGTSLKEMRVMAARHGANALLVLQGGCEVESHMNFAAVLNVTVVGGFLVPASHRDALFVLQGGLVDVGNEYLYASIEAEGEGHIIRPTFVIEDNPAMEKAKQKAFENFTPELLKRLRAVHAGLTQAPPQFAGGNVIPTIVPSR